jgi:ubiquinone/menaquinone biosynthesis C-methylase UbiE
VDSGQQALLEVFGKRARHYDVTSNLSGYLTGMRMVAYRRLAVDLLALRQGDTVVDAGCGTGLNFARILDRIGPAGRIVGIDFSEPMLEQARVKVSRSGWDDQVSLVHGSLSTLDIPGCDAILGFLSVTLLPDFDDLVARGFAALRPGGRWVVHDYRVPPWFPQRWMGALEPLIKPFGGNMEMAARHPWESVQRHAGRSVVLSRNGGFAYFAVGEKA